jgi:hypothetical protein
MKILNNKWKTKERLNEVLYSLKKIKLNNFPEIWDKWCSKYDKTRNEVIHSGKEPSKEETEETLDINKKVIDWLLSI